MADPKSLDAFLRGFTRLMLLSVLVAFTGGVFYLFADTKLLPWCYVALGLVYLSWFTCEFRRRRLDFSSFLMPLLLMAGLILFFFSLISVVQIREPRGRPVVVNDLRQIGIALHNYHDKYGTFPPAAIHAPDGTPLYSWR